MKFWANQLFAKIWPKQGEIKHRNLWGFRATSLHTGEFFKNLVGK